MDGKNVRKKSFFALIAGALAGFVNGTFGGGGGMIIVPLLVWLIGYPNKKAHATAILVILPFSILSGLMYSSFGIVNVSELIPVTVGATVGGVLGALFLSKLSSKVVAVIFSAVMCAAGVKMLLF